MRLHAHNNGGTVMNANNSHRRYLKACDSHLLLVHTEPCAISNRRLGRSRRSSCWFP